MRRIALAAGAIGPVFALLFGLLLGGGGGSGNSGGGACGPAGGPAVAVGTGAIAWPMAPGAYRLSSGYGIRGGVLHRGTDLAAPIGTPILAAHDGIVERSGPASGFGLWIVVTGQVDGQTVSTVYGHNDRNLVVEGATVAAGQQIAEVGNRGESTGPHLHFEVWPGGRFGGTSVDPQGWLSSNVRPGQDTPSTPPVVDVSDVDTSTVAGTFPPAGKQATMTIGEEQRANVEVIVGVVKGQGLPLRAAVVAVATAMQESSLRNIDYGDRDSIGMFQQRDPWGTREARLDPVQTTVMFLNGGTGGQPGLQAFDWPSMSLAVAAQSVQVSAFPAAYAKWEVQAMALVLEAEGVDPITAGAAAGGYGVCAAVDTGD